MNKHTPGPWTIIVCGHSPLHISAKIKNADDLSERSIPICVVIADEREGQDDEANARLIAVAPELFIALEVAIFALKLGIDVVNEHVDTGAVIEYGLEVLDKASGGGGGGER